MSSVAEVLGAEVCLEVITGDVTWRVFSCPDFSPEDEQLCSAMFLHHALSTSKPTDYRLDPLETAPDKLLLLCVVGVWYFVLVIGKLTYAGVYLFWVHFSNKSGSSYFPYWLSSSRLPCTHPSYLRAKSR